MTGSAVVIVNDVIVFADADRANIGDVARDDDGIPEIPVPEIARWLAFGVGGEGGEAGKLPGGPSTSG
jgi:hypothetical protein